MMVEQPASARDMSARTLLPLEPMRASGLVIVSSRTRIARPRAHQHALAD
jgi:hypothetical protein